MRQYLEGRTAEKMQDLGRTDGAPVPTRLHTALSLDFPQEQI